MYAGDNKDFLPPGKRDYPGGSDDLVWFNGTTWTNLQTYGWNLKNCYCESVAFDQTYAPYFGTDCWSTPDNVLLGWQYWGGRSVAGTTTYTFPQKFTDHTTTTSDTLLTCFCYRDVQDAGNPNGWKTVMPHVRGSAFKEYAAGTPSSAIQFPDGLAVGRVDGSAHWVKWNQLASFTSADTFWYEPR